jgi:hypothetical protein
MVKIFVQVRVRVVAGNLTLPEQSLKVTARETRLLRRFAQGKGLAGVQG